MKIEKAKNEIIKDFEVLTVGDAFYPLNHFSSDLYIKTYDFECLGVCDDDTEDYQYNAIKLSNGKPCWFDDSYDVVVPNCKVVVE